MGVTIKEQPYEDSVPMPASAPVSEWKLVNNGTAMGRRLRGVELLVKSSENYNDGNFQLTAMGSIQSPLSCEQLNRRAYAAWWQTRRSRPVVGVTSTLDEAVFEPLRTPETARRWAAKTCRVVSNTTVSDTYLALSRQNSDITTMTLVVDPVRGERGCIINISHTLVSHEAFLILQDFVSQLARPENELGIEAIFSPESLFESRARLPRSLCHAYSLLPQPTAQELYDVLQLQEQAQARWARSSVGIPVHPDWKNRPSRIHNKIIRFEPDEKLAASKSLKKLGISLTTAFFACITSGIAQTFGTGDEEGAHLVYSGNARRWVDLEARDGHSPITMGIVPGGMWVDGSEVDVRAKDKKGLAELAKVIQREQNKDLVSPHIIGVLDQAAPALAKAMGASQTPPPVPAISRPTLTSQGLFKDDDCTSPGSDPMRMSDFNSGGRNTDPNVCFALNSFRDELRYNLLFDERFFDQDQVMQLAYVVAGLFRRLIAEEPPRARL